MTPTRIATSDTVGAAVAASTRSDRRRRSAAWLTTTDHKGIGRHVHRQLARSALAATAVVGVLLGIERIDGDDSLLDAGALPQLFPLFRVGLVFGVLVPLLLGVAVAVVPLQLGARSLAFPRLAAAGFWTWLGGLVLVVVSLADNGGPGGGDAEMVDLFLAAHVLLVVGLAAAARVASPPRCSPPGRRACACAGCRCSPGRRWSRASGCCSLLPVARRRARLPLRRPPARPGAVRRQRRHRLAGSASPCTQPATYLFALPAIGIAAELIPVTFRQRMPMRGVVSPGSPSSASPPCRRSPSRAFHEPAVVGQRARRRRLGTKFDDLVPYAHLQPAAAARRPDRDRRSAPLAVRTSDGRATPAERHAPFLFAFFGLGMILVGMLGGALYPIADLGLQGTVFEEGALVYVVYGARARRRSAAIAYWAPKCAGRTMPDKPAMRPRPARRARHRARLAAVLRRRLRRPAGGLAATYDYDGPPSCGTRSSPIGHALMLLTVARLRRACR